MKNYIELLEKCELFNSIKSDEILKLLDCLCAEKHTYKKDEYIFSDTDKVSTVGIVLSGTLQILKEDFWGNRTILSNVQEGHLFGESFVCSNIQFIPLSVVACENCEVLFIDYKKIISKCPSCCSFHDKLLQNMINIMANKNVMLTQKIEHLTKRSIREKLLSYLSAQSNKFENNTFEIEYNRQELADYLAIDRSAMSKELCKLRDENLIKFNKNHFELL